jgi:hypothetical protein
MEYNSQKDHLIISEYGRNVQELIMVAKSERDDSKRQLMAEAIVNLMYQMNPVNKNNDENKEKLWRHLFRIADYDIKVTPPDGIIPTPENTRIRPKRIEYPENIKANRHYGKYVRDLIKKAIEMEDQELQDEFTMVIASYMKLAYRNWNREHFVSDDIIKEDLIKMSQGKLRLADDDSIDLTVQLSRNTNTNNSRRRNSNSRNNSGRNRNNYRGSNSNNNSRRRR